MATALHERTIALGHFSEVSRNDPKITADCAKVRVTVDPVCEAKYPRFRPAKVTLRTTDGRAFHGAVDEPLGAPRNPLDDAALGAKYLDLAVPVLGAERAQATLEMLWRLDELAEVTGLCDALRVDGPRTPRRAGTMRARLRSGAARPVNTNNR